MAKAKRSVKGAKRATVKAAKTTTAIKKKRAATPAPSLLREGDQ